MIITKESDLLNDFLLKFIENPLDNLGYFTSTDKDVYCLTGHLWFGLKNSIGITTKLHTF